jgi:hypothetical protein
MYTVHQINHACWGVVDPNGRYVDMFLTEAAAEAEAQRRNKKGGRDGLSDKNRA